MGLHSRTHTVVTVDATGSVSVPARSVVVLVTPR
jgi:hypothetical protein